MAIENPKDFGKLVGMVVPREIELDISGKVELQSKIEHYHQHFQAALEYIGSEPLLLEAEANDRGC